MLKSDGMKAQNLNIDHLYFWSVFRSTINTTLFLISVWYLFMYGKNDLALTETMEIVNYLYILPFLSIPVLMVFINRLKSPTRTLIFNIILIGAFGILFTQSLIVWINPIFASRWTWAFNDMRELNYLNPSFKIIICVCFSILILQDNKEITTYISQMRINDTKKSQSMRICYTLCISGGFGIWGIFQYIFSSQPIWLSFMILMNMTFFEIMVNMAIILKNWKKFENDWLDNEKWIESKKYSPTIQYRILLFSAIFGFFLISTLTLFFPIQLAYQEGPSNPWGLSLIIAVGLATIFIGIWFKYKVSGYFGLLTAIIGSIITPIIIAVNWNSIPGSVEIGQYFGSLGFVLLFCWIIYFSNHGEEKRSGTLQQWFLWIWSLCFLILSNDPLFEIWEMEEGLRKIFGPDAYGTGVGLYYGVIAQVWIFILIGVLILGILKKYVINNSNRSKNDIQSPKTFDNNIHQHIEVKINQRFKTIAMALCIIGLVGGSSCLILTGIELQKSNPTVVARMGNHGVLWLANSYDRVLPDYRPNFAASPVNSTIEIYAMRGETETIQVVYSPLASKMVSFQYYQWSHNGTFTKADNLWKGPNGIIANISIKAGRIGYLSSFDSNIADIILPWSAFITGDRKNIPFWLDVSVPYNITAGVYTTQFQFITTSWLQRNIQAASLDFEIKLNVWDINKPRNRTFETCINYFPENPANTEKLIDLGLQYGVDPYGVATEAIWGSTLDMVDYDATNLSKGLTINWTYFDVRVAEMFEKGMNQIKLDFYPGIDCRNHGEAVLNGSKDNYLTLIGWFYGNASEHLKIKYTPWGTTWESETITQHSDEPDWRISPYAIDAFRKLYLLLDNVTEIKSLQTFMYEPEYDPWLDCLDIWVLTPDSYSIEVAQKIRAAGREVWTYSNGDNFPGGDTDVRTPLIMSRLRGWVNFHYNITGFLDWVFYWNFNDAGRSGNGYDGRGDGTEIVPFYGNYVPTLRLVAFRDGLEDYELLHMLQLMIDKAIELNQADSDEYQTAVKVMQKITSALSKQPADNKWALPTVTREFNHTASLYLQLRIEAGNALTGLINQLE